MPKPKRKKKNSDKEKICEIFEVEKDNKTETKRVCELAEKKHATKKQIEAQNRILKNFLMGLGIIVILIIAGVYFVNSVRHFSYRGLNFDVIHEGDIIFYQTSIPVNYNGKIIPYNFYLRNDPREIEEIEFNEEIRLLKNVVVNQTEEFNCDGDGVIAMANLVKLYQVIGAEVITDENATCDSRGKYMFFQIQPGNKTTIEKEGSSCYIFNINNCEILEVTERFMIETLVKTNEILKQKSAI